MPKSEKTRKQTNLALKKHSEALLGERPESHFEMFQVPVKGGRAFVILHVIQPDPGANKAPSYMADVCDIMANIANAERDVIEVPPLDRPVG